MKMAIRTTTTKYYIIWANKIIKIIIKSVLMYHGGGVIPVVCL